MKWEYKAVVIQLLGDSLNKPLNKLGDEGWELVWWDMPGNAFIFKRPKPLDIKAKEPFDGDVIEMRKAIEGYFGGKVG